MQLHRYVLALGLTVLVPATLAAQTPAATPADQGGSGATTTTTTTTTTTPIGDSFFTRGVSRWLASGFVGSNYNNNSGELSTSTGISAMNNAESSVDFGGSVGYLWHNVVGGEFVANFTPDFHMQNSLLASTSTPSVNSYMFNLMAAAPFGADDRWQPFVSGGFGAVTLSADQNDFESTFNGTFNTDENRGGGNIGFGLMGFMGGWGVRGDVRYFKAFSGGNDNGSAVAAANAAETTGSGSTGDSFSLGPAPRPELLAREHRHRVPVVGPLDGWQ